MTDLERVQIQAHIKAVKRVRNIFFGLATTDDKFIHHLNAVRRMEQTLTKLEIMVK